MAEAVSSSDANAELFDTARQARQFAYESMMVCDEGTCDAVAMSMVPGLRSLREFFTLTLIDPGIEAELDPSVVEEIHRATVVMDEVLNPISEV